LAPSALPFALMWGKNWTLIIVAKFVRDRWNIVLGELGLV
jgi:hypothetical protein